MLIIALLPVMGTYAQVSNKPNAYGFIRDSIVPEREAVNTVRSFYMYWLSDGPDRSLKNDSMNLAKYVTPECVKQVRKASLKVNADNYIRAQDTDEWGVKTLKVEHLERNWYMVSFKFGIGSPYEKCDSIPVRVTNHDGKCKICYVTPSWDGRKYGDGYLTRKAQQRKTGNRKNP